MKRLVVAVVTTAVLVIPAAPAHATKEPIFSSNCSSKNIPFSFFKTYSQTTTNSTYQFHCSGP